MLHCCFITLKLHGNLTETKILNTSAKQGKIFMLADPCLHSHDTLYSKSLYTNGVTTALVVSGRTRRAGKGLCLLLSQPLEPEGRAKCQEASGLSASPKGHAGTPGVCGSTRCISRCTWGDEDKHFLLQTCHSGSVKPESTGLPESSCSCS